MKSILEQSTREEVKNRIQSLREEDQPAWGKMSVSQMMKHCSQWDEMALGRRKYKQSLIGRIFGRKALKDFLTDAPFKKNLPTVPAFKIKGELNFADEKLEWLRSLNSYNQYTDEGFIHPFFGALTREQTGIMVYKHADHHLRQFNR
jgi:hypothetical protein